MSASPSAASSPAPDVQVYLGPILMLGGLHHLPGRLEGLIRSLRRAGVDIEQITEVDDYRRLWIEVFDRCVWTADPADLRWGSDGMLDPVCDEAVRAVIRAL